MSSDRSPKWSATAEIGDQRVVVSPGGDKVFVLDAIASWIWEARREGWREEEVIEALVDRFPEVRHRIRADLDRLDRDWVRAGICGNGAVDLVASRRLLEPEVASLEPPELATRIGYRFGPHRVGIGYGDELLSNALHPLLAHLSPEATDETSLLLFAADGSYCLTDSSGRCWFEASTLADAIGSTVAILIELACRASDWLCIVHGAGLEINGEVILLPGASGSGKSTLAAALALRGAALFSDDVVPIARRQYLAQPVPAPVCLKPGSWSVLEKRGAGLHTFPVVTRFGETVRFLPPPVAAQEPQTVTAMVFPRFDPKAATRLERLSPALLLQHLLENQSVLPRPLSQPLLNDLLNWIGSVPAWSLCYHDLDDAVSAIENTRSLTTDV